MALRFRILPTPQAVSGKATVLPEGPSAERTFEISPDQSEVRIGRRRDVEIELPFPVVSALHARLVRVDGIGDVAADWRIEDLGSRNGTWLDGARLSPGRPAPLRPGQRLRIATVDLVFEGWSARSEGDEGTATIARRLISDLFGVAAGERAALTIESGAARHPTLRLEVAGRRYLIGRAESCDLILLSEDVSREHAAFVRRWNGVAVSDLGSKNGVRVNGQRIVGDQQLADGDRVTVGSVTMRLTDPEDRYLRRIESLGSQATVVPAGDAAAPGNDSPTPEPSLDDQSGPATPSSTPAPAPPDPPALVARRRSPYRWLIATLVLAVALLAAAGLVALWLATR
jgi:pSer/pThr/pTyr-binding forkhead associated (FHA) protein